MARRWLKLKAPSRSTCTLFTMSCFRTKIHGSDDDELSHGNVHYITTVQTWEAQLSQASRDGKIVVANFSVAWSKPCRDIAKTYCELAHKYSRLVFLTVDTHELAELVSWWDVKATPTFYFLKDGRQIDKLVGAEKEELQKKVAAIIDLAKKSRR